MKSNHPACKLQAQSVEPRLIGFRSQCTSYYVCYVTGSEIILLSSRLADALYASQNNLLMRKPSIRGTSSDVFFFPGT